MAEKGLRHLGTHNYLTYPSPFLNRKQYMNLFLLVWKPMWYYDSKERGAMYVLCMYEGR